MQDFESAPETRRRQVELPNGNKYHIECRDPYGFWFIHMDKGQIPDRLSGAYTSADQAVSDINRYLATKPKEKESKEK